MSTFIDPSRVTLWGYSFDDAEASNPTKSEVPLGTIDVGGNTSSLGSEVNGSGIRPIGDTSYTYIYNEPGGLLDPRNHTIFTYYSLAVTFSAADLAPHLQDISGESFLLGQVDIGWSVERDDGSLSGTSSLIDIGYWSGGSFTQVQHLTIPPPSVSANTGDPTIGAQIAAGNDIVAVLTPVQGSPIEREIHPSANQDPYYPLRYTMCRIKLSGGPAIRPPLRQRQRSDGLAASGAPRHHQHSTLQTSNRQRAVR